ncbi:centrosomal protein POC5-like [Liolophura sinensis]|uniref:centrosomal protein POC5-like n=1 Tax=Liolophura sinensis TaxID=3198878 RepID=UPI00315941EC
MSSVGDQDSIPALPSDSPGSSVSSHFQEEYDELLKYAVVMPNYNPHTLAGTSEDQGTSQPQPRPQTQAPPQLQPQPQAPPQFLDTIITISSQADAFQDRSHDSQATDTLVDVSQGSSAQRVGSAQKSPVMRDIFPELTDDDVYTRPESLSAEQDRIHDSRHSAQQGKSNTSHSRQYYSPHLGHSVSTDSDVPEDVRHVVFSATIDPDLNRMENLLDQWCTDLKRNVLAEYGQSKIQLVEINRIALQKEKERHAADLEKVKNDMENLKELLHTYEQSVERKDQVIANLTNALQKNREKMEMMKKFNEWKLRLSDSGREAFASNLAKLHYQRKLCQKVWAGWHSVIESSWKQRVEKACQAKAQEVCLNLTNEYEARIAALSEALEAARAEVTQLHKERDRFEEQMKKAFMRGVCALNVEAMTIFQGGEEDSQNGVDEASPTEDISCNFESSLPCKDYGHQKSIPKEPAPRPDREVPQRSKPPPRSTGVTSQTTTARSTVSVQ